MLIGGGSKGKADCGEPLIEDWVEKNIQLESGGTFSDSRTCF
jgi:hypothetical protein